MSATTKILKALCAGRVVHTRPHDQACYGTNQVPDVIRKIRRKHGANAVVTRMVAAPSPGGNTRVAEYRMPKCMRRQIRAEMSP